MPKRRKLPSRIRRVYTKARRTGRRAKSGMRSITGRFNFGASARAGGILLLIDKGKQMLGFQIGSQRIDDGVDMILTGLVDGKSGFMVPAGTALVIKELADNAIFGGAGFNLGGMFGGMGRTGGGSYAGD